MSGATFIDLSGALQIQMGGREVAQISPGAAFQFRQRINLATNPSFEALSGSSVVATNQFQYPLLTSNAIIGPWAGTGAVTDRVPVDDSRFEGGRAIRSTFTTAGTGTYSTMQLNGAAAGLALQRLAGSQVTVAFRIVNSRTILGTYAVSMMNVVGDGLPASVSPTARYSGRIEAGEVGTLWATFDIPAGLTSANINFSLPLGQMGEENFVGDIDVYTGDYQPNRRFFHGGLSPDPDLTPAWTGMANASTSELRGQAVATVSAENGANCAPVTSTRWAQSGARSLRLAARGNSNSTSAHVGGNMTTTSTSNVLRPGHTYRISATCHLAAPQTGALHANARRMEVYRSPVAGWGAGFVYDGPAAPNEAGDHRVTHTVSIPADYVWALLRLNNGASLGNGDVWWDDLLIEDVTDQMPADDSFFSGSSPSSADVLHHWTGPADASTSAATQAWPPT